MKITLVTSRSAVIDDGKGWPAPASVSDDYCALCHRRGPEDGREHGDGPCEHKRALVHALARAEFEPDPDDPRPAELPPQVVPLDVAIEKARAAFAGYPASLRRLERAIELVAAGGVTDLGGGEFEVLGSRAAAYRVNGACSCPDHRAGTTWCKHRLAVALVLKARQIENGAGSARNTPAPAPAPDGTDTRPQDTPDVAPRQIELVVAYDAGEGLSPLRITHGDGDLVTVKADGQVIEPPVGDLPGLYRWLQAGGYVPSGFNWLHGLTLGKRQRRQVYTRPAAAPEPERPRGPVVARYADGRPARYANGTQVRYTAGGRAVEIPARSW